MRRRPRCAAANATRHESHPTSAAYPRPRPCVARNGSGAGRARWRRRCRSRARRRRTMPPPRTRASPAAPSRSAACTAPLPAFEGLAGGASPPSDRPSSSHRRVLLCVRLLLPATWYLARRQTDGVPASLWSPPRTRCATSAPAPHADAIHPTEYPAKTRRSFLPPRRQCLEKASRQEKDDALRHASLRRHEPGDSPSHL